MNQINFSDIFKKSFIGMTTGLERFSTLDVIINVMLSFAIGMFIFYIYKKTFQGVLYQKSFNITLVIVTIVTSLIIMTISGNLVLSLGMVGALSIVRFRTPIKDPIDLAFIFWAITVGIANGVSYFNISIIGSVLISMILLFLTRTDEIDNPFLLVLQAPLESKTDDITAILSYSVKKFKLKSESVNSSFSEFTFEVKLKKDSTSFLKELKDGNTVSKATLISYSGDMAGI